MLPQILIYNLRVKINLIKHVLLTLFLLLFFSSPSFANKFPPPRTLTVYCSNSFANDWMQIGHPIKRAFEFKCNCKLELIILDDGTAALSRIALEEKNSPADIIIGIDSSLLEKAKQSGLFAPSNVSLENLNLPIEWDDEYFVPYNYAYLAFIYNESKLKNPPQSLQELIDYPDKNFKIAIQDPRTSSSGLGLLLWIKKIYKDQSINAWIKLKKKILTITKGWSGSYSLFNYGEVDMVLSYNTSPAYHMMAENNNNIKAASFKEGHYLQIELVGKLKNSKEPELADQFMQFILSHSFQKLIPINNFMLPVINLGSDMPKEYNKIFIPSEIHIIPAEDFNKNKNLWIKEWLEALSKD